MLHAENLETVYIGMSFDQRLDKPSQNWAQFNYVGGRSERIEPLDESAWLRLLAWLKEGATFDQQVLTDGHEDGLVNNFTVYRIVSK